MAQKLSIKLSFLFLISSFFFIHAAYAQDKLTGRVYENKTKAAIPGIKVENLKSQQTTATDSAGRFSIIAKKGDLVLFSGPNYRPDTVFVGDFREAEIYLESKQNMLKEVKVITPELKTGSLTATPQKGPLGGHTVLYRTDWKDEYIDGIKIMLYDWNKDERKKKRDRQIEIDEQTKLQIASAFSLVNLQNYLPIKGQELNNFIILYTPDVKTYISAGFNFLSYLNSSYQEFLKIPEEKRRSKTFLQLQEKN